MNSSRIIRAVAGFDLFVTAVLALPISAHVFVRFVYLTQSELTGIDTFAPAIPPIGWLFFNIAGILGVLWAWVRIAMPLRELALADALTRCVVATMIVYYYFIESVPSILLVFVATEVLGAAIQWVAIRQPDSRSTTLESTP